jgi:hypothetical protein
MAITLSIASVAFLLLLSLCFSSIGLVRLSRLLSSSRISDLNRQIREVSDGAAGLATKLELATKNIEERLTSATHLIEELRASQGDLAQEIDSSHVKTDEILLKLSKSLTSTEESINNAAKTMEESANTLTENFPKQITELGVLVRQEFAGQVIRNRSWLASPYPKRLKISPPSTAWERIRQGASFLGIRLAGPLSVKVVCEGCEDTTEDDPYVLDGVRVEFDKEAVRFYLSAGIAVGMIVITDRLPPLHFVVRDPDLLVKLRAAVDQIPHMAKEIAKDLSPELIAKITFDRFKSKEGPPLSEGEVDSTARKLRDQLGSNALTAINLGENAHLHIGKLIEEQDSDDLRSRRPYGGLVRVLTKDERAYKWVCDDCWAKHYKPLEQPSS